jgi:hypothetical protein
MKLSGTIRLGIVFSVVWVFACSVIVAFQMYGPYQSCDATVFTFLQNPKLVGFVTVEGGFDISTAIKVGETNCPPPEMVRQLKTQSSVLVTFLPVLAAWLFCSIAVLSFRWVKAGYSSGGGNA